MAKSPGYDLFGQDSNLQNWTKTGMKYQGVIHLLGELFQNSIRNFKEHGVEKGRIHCAIDIPNQEFVVTDNGTGFTTFKTMGVNQSEWQNSDGGSGMGVGLKAVISNSNEGHYSERLNAQTINSEHARVQSFCIYNL